MDAPPQKGKRKTVAFCTFSGCDLPEKAKGLCSTHHKQFLSSGVIKPIRKKYGKLCTFEQCQRPHSSYGLCSMHNQRRKSGKPLTDPVRTAPATADCATPYCNSSMPVGRDACRRCRYMCKIYNISLENYCKMRRLGCAVCGSSKKLSVDHDHSCCDAIGSCGECVRGVLCSACNFSIGHAMDNPTTLRSMASYIENFKGSAS